MNINTGDLKQYIKGDKVIWVIIVALTCLSLLVVYSSTGALAYRQAHGNTSHSFLRQLLFQAQEHSFIGFIVGFKKSRHQCMHDN